MAIGVVAKISINGGKLIKSSMSLKADFALYFNICA